MRRGLLTVSLCLLSLGMDACAGSLGPGFGLGPALDPLITVVTLGLIAAGAFLLVRRFTAESRAGGSSSTGATVAQAILAERYARGELGREEYLEKMKDIQRRSF